MNEVRLYGRIAKELPHIEELTAKPLLLVLAVDKFVAGEKDVDFIPIKVWGKMAKNICEYKSKGDELIVLGRLNVGKYEKNGQMIYALEVVATSVEFVGTRKKDISQTQIDDANATAAALQEENMNDEHSNNSFNQNEPISSDYIEEKIRSEDDDFLNNVLNFSFENDNTSPFK